MKKVLVISYYWPPAGGPGSQRVVKFVKYLPQFGWQPIVLTVKDGEFPYFDSSLEKDIHKDLIVYRTKSWEPFVLYKKLTGRQQQETLPVGLLTTKKKNFIERFASSIRTNFFVPDARIGWIPFATKRALEIMRDEKIDLIFSSSPPHSLQLIAKKLKKKTGLPWVTDFRDPWTDIRYYKSIDRSRWAQNKDLSFEIETIRDADAVTSVSNSVLKNFQKRLESNYQNKFHVIPNGYDEDDFKNISSEKSPYFLILHTGNLLDNQNPQVLLRSLKNLIDKSIIRKDQILLKFIGRIPQSVDEDIYRFELQSVLIKSGFIEHSEVLKEIKKAAILLMVIPNIENNEGIVTSKLFEYIGSGRPILVIGPPQSDAGKIVSDFENSIICDYEDDQVCMNFITRIFNSWVNSNQVPTIPETYRTSYSREYLARLLADIFNSIVS